MTKRQQFHRENGLSLVCWFANISLCTSKTFEITERYRYRSRDQWQWIATIDSFSPLWDRWNTSERWMASISTKIIRPIVSTKLSPSRASKFALTRNQSALIAIVSGQRYTWIQCVHFFHTYTVLLPANYFSKFNRFNRTNNIIIYRYISSNENSWAHRIWKEINVARMNPFPWIKGGG